MKNATKLVGADGKKFDLAKAKMRCQSMIALEADPGGMVKPKYRYKAKLTLRSVILQYPKELREALVTRAQQFLAGTAAGLPKAAKTRQPKAKAPSAKQQVLGRRYSEAMSELSIPLDEMEIMDAMLSPALPQGDSLDHVGRFIDNGMGYVLCQGYVKTQNGGRAIHCWIENPTYDCVLDATQGVLEARHTYYRVHGVKEVRMYDWTHVVNRADTNGAIRAYFWDYPEEWPPQDRAFHAADTARHKMRPVQSTQANR